MAGSLYLSYEMAKSGYKVVVSRNSFRAFRSLSPKTAVKLLREWIKDIEALDQRFPNEKDE